MTVTDIPVAQEDDIRLIIQQEPGGQVDSTIFVSWCIVSDVFKETIKSYDDPAILIVVENNLQEVSRHVADLTDAGMYISFRCPGLNILHACVVRKGSDKRSIAKEILVRYSGWEILNTVQPEVREEQGRSSSLWAKIDQTQAALRDEQAKAGKTIELRAKLVGDRADTEDETLLGRQAELSDEITSLYTQLIAIGRDSAKLDILNAAPNAERMAELEAEIADLQEQKAVVDDQIVQLRETAETVAEIGSYGAVTSNTYKVGREYTQNVEVPEAMFAKEPSKIINWLATQHDWPRPARDQCQMRRRAIHACTVLWMKWLVLIVPTIVLEFVNVVVLIVLILAARRDIRFSILLHPYKSWKGDESLSRPSIYTTKVQIVEQADGSMKQTYPEREFFFLRCIINPPVLAIIGIALWQFSNHVDIPWQLVGVFAGCLLAAILLFLLVSSTAKSMKSKKSSRPFADVPTNKPPRETTKHRRQRLQREAYQREVDLLACERRPVITSFEAIPPEKRTIALRYDHLKTKVCKPFAS